jgi:biopolymer transport protein ExbD
MARTFRRNRQMHPIAELNVTNLIDLGFTLLIIFMIATPLINQEQTISVKLPTEEKSPQTRPDPTQRTETITVDAKGNYFLNGRPVAMRELQVQLRTFAEAPKPPIIRIAGDVVVNWGKVAAVIAEVKKYGSLSHLDIATEAGK